MSPKSKQKLLKELEELLKQKIPDDKKEIADRVRFIIANDQAINKFIDDEFDKFKKKSSKGLPKSKSLKGSWWRAINRIYDLEPLSVEGSLHGAGRFHEQGEETIYLAENSTTCNLEVQLDKNFVTYSLWAIDFKLSGVLDLTGSKNLNSSGIHAGLLYGVWEILNMYKISSYSQRVASYLRGLGYEGLIYKSTKDKGKKCAVIFSDNLKKGSFLEIHDKTQGIKAPYDRIDGKL